MKCAERVVALSQCAGRRQHDRRCRRATPIKECVRNPAGPPWKLRSNRSERLSQSAHDSADMTGSPWSFSAIRSKASRIRRQCCAEPVLKVALCKQRSRLFHAAARSQSEICRRRAAANSESPVPLQPPWRSKPKAGQAYSPRVVFAQRPGSPRRQKGDSSEHKRR